MERWVGVVLMALMTQGCVGLGDYQALEDKHSHLLDVKETWESEQSELSRRVEDARLAYQRMTVEQANLKTQIESVVQAVRATKSDMQTLGNTVEGQGNLFKEQQRQFGIVTDHFSQVIAQGATLAETNTMLANRVEGLTKLTKQTATKVADVNKKIARAGAKRTVTAVESSETEESGAKEKPVVLSNKDVLPVSPAPASPGPDASEASPVAGPGAPLTASPNPSAIHPAHGPVAAGGEGHAKPLASVAPSTPEAVLAPKSESSTKSGRWEQVKDLLGKIRPTSKKGPEAPAPTALSRPAPATGPSHAGEAMAAAPEPHGLSTISLSPGIPAPGAVIPVPPAPNKP